MVDLKCSIWADVLDLTEFRYGYADLAPQPAATTVYYWLEELHTDHGPIRHGPQRVGAAGSLRIYLPAITLGATDQAAPAEPPARVGIPAPAVAPNHDLPHKQGNALWPRL